MPKLEDLELKIKQTGSISTAGFKNLSEALERLSAAVKSFPKQADNVAAVNSAIKSINADKATALAKVATGLAKLADSASKVDVKSAGNIAAIGAAIEQMVDGIDTTKLSTISDALSKFKTSVNALKSGGGINRAVKESAVKSLGETTAPAEKETVAVTAEDVSEDVSEASEKVEKFRTNLWQLFKTAKAPMWSPIKKGIQGIQEHLKKAASGAINLLSAFKRIAMYRMLRTAIKSITQGFATGIKHLYAWSDLVGNNFKQSMDSLSTSANYLRNSLGAMVSPLIDALAPAVEVLVEKFVTLLNTINQFFATITGADTWRRAVRQQKEYAENTDKAAGAQKKLNHQLMAFDELNNITMGGSGGSGSGGKTPEVDDGSFVIEQTPDWAKGIKEAIENGDWYGAGAALATKINGLLNDFDAVQFGHRLADKIQNGINAFNGFMDTLDWTGVGLKASEIVNELFKGVTPESVGEAIIQPINAGIQMLKGLVVGGYKEYLDPTTGETFREWKDGLDFSGIGEWIGTAFMTAINNIKWEEAGETLGKLASGLASLIVSAIEKIKVEDVLTAFRDFIGGIFSGLWGEDGKGMLSVVKLVGWIAGIKLVFKGLSAAFASTFGDVVTEGAATALADSAVISSVKTSFSTFLSTAGLVGFTIVATVALAWAASAIVDNIKKYGVDKGLWESLSIIDPEMKVKLGLDDKDFIDSFSDLIGTWGPVLKALGIEVPDVETGSTGSTSTPTTAGVANYDIGGNYAPTTAGAGWLDSYDWTQYSAPAVSALEQVRDAAAAAHKKVNAIPPDNGSVEDFKKRTGQEKTATKEVGTAADTAKKKLAALPPEGADLTKFKNGMKTEKSAVSGVSDAAGDAKGDIKAMIPGTADTTVFKNRLKPWKDALNGKDASVARSAGKAGDALLGIIPTEKEGNLFKKALTPWKGALNGKDASIARSAGKAEEAVLDVTPTANESNTFSTTMGDWTDAIGLVEDPAVTLKNALVSSAKSRTITLTESGLSTAAEKAAQLRKDLETSGKSWKINITSDLRLKSANGTSFTVEPMAEGGFPQQGSLFLAGEQINQTELVGNINGRTGVASGAEITGIADAVYNTGASEAALLREQNQLLRQLLSKKTDITLAPNVAAGRWVAQAQTAYARATGG